MTVEYYPDTDTLYVALRPGPSANAAEVSPDVVLDYDADGHVIGVTVEHASERADLASLAITKVPVLTA